MTPSFSVILVSDYEAGEELSWNQLRETAGLLARESDADDVEFLYVETRAFQNRLPDDIAEIFPALQIVWSDAEAHYELKNEGARLARAPIVAFIDVDCRPRRGWIRAVKRAFRDDPEIEILTGRTCYAGRTFAERVFAVTSRGYLDPGAPGETHTLGPNNCAMTRDVCLEFPFRSDIGAFGERLHAEELRRNGYRMRFEPEMLVVHAHEGWEMEREIRRNTGYCTIKARCIDPRIAYSGLTRLGPLTVPAFLLARTVYDWRLILRLYSAYGVPWYQVPAAMALSAYAVLFEIPGMVTAVRGDVLETAYR